MSYWRERTHTRRHEQFTAAYSVQVVQGERPSPGQSVQDPSALVLVAVVINRGPYTITGVEVQFCLDGGTPRPAANCERVSNFARLPDELRKPGDVSEERAMKDVLTPWDAGMRAESDEVPVQELRGHYAAVSWTDQWGQRWQHGPGTVQRIRLGPRAGPGPEQWTRSRHESADERARRRYTNRQPKPATVHLVRLPVRPAGTHGHSVNQAEAIQMLDQCRHAALPMIRSQLAPDRLFAPARIDGVETCGAQIIPFCTLIRELPSLPESALGRLVQPGHHLRAMSNQTFSHFAVKMDAWQAQARPSGNAWRRSPSESSIPGGRLRREYAYARQWPLTWTRSANWRRSRA